MTDRHLNLFYTYNRDNQLIENNLTRAWIICLRMVSADVRNAFLHALFHAPWTKLPEPGSELPSFAQAEFALQGWMKVNETRRFNRRFLVTIAGAALDINVEEDQNSEREGKPPNSIPDAWIFDRNLDYCFLVEAKIGSNSLDNGQLSAHASDWLDLTTEAQIRSNLIAVSWTDVARSIEQVEAQQALNEQERLLLAALREYLGFHGYRVFHGFQSKSLGSPPSFSLSTSSITAFGYARANLLKRPPSFRLALSL